MIRALTKLDRNGEPYNRPSEVESAIERALGQDIETLEQRAMVIDPASDAYLKPEVLVHLIREARHANNESLMGKLLLFLWTRCKKTLDRVFSTRQKTDAGDDITEILCELTLLFMADGQGANPDKLDFFECRFNRAFRYMYLDKLRKIKTKEKQFATISFSSMHEIDNADEEELGRRLDKYRVESTQECEFINHQLMEAILSLPEDERKAIELHYFSGYPIEAIDDKKPTVASICGVSGRTIRTRLANGRKMLKKIMEGS